MKDKLIDFYLRKCLIKKKDKFRTAAYKPGIADDCLKRDTKSDFNKSLNSNPKVSTSKDGSSLDTQVETSLSIRAPQFFIKPLEKFVINEYFDGEEKFFDTSNEYFSSYEETSKKYENLVHSLSNKDGRLAELNNSYVELQDNQTTNLSFIQKEYDKIFSDIQIELKKFCDPIAVHKNKNVIQAPTTPQTPITTKINLTSNLVNDFILFIDNDKAYLQHKTYHKGKDPKEYKGSFTSALKNNNKPKFQFHNTSELSYYDASCISYNKAVNIFKKAGISPIVL